MAKWCFFLPWGQDRDSFRETPGRRPSYNRQIDTQWLWYSWRDEDHHHHHHHDDWWWWWPCWYCSCGIFFLLLSSLLLLFLHCFYHPTYLALAPNHGTTSTAESPGIPWVSQRKDPAERDTCWIKATSWICYSHRSMRELPIPKTHKVEGPMLIFRDLSRIFRDSKNMFGSNPGRWFQNMKTHVCTWYLVINSKPYCPLFWG